jgi:hypothetical protein
MNTIEGIDVAAMFREREMNMRHKQYRAKCFKGEALEEQMNRFFETEDVKDVVEFKLTDEEAIIIYSRN